MNDGSTSPEHLTRSARAVTRARDDDGPSDAREVVVRGFEVLAALRTLDQTAGPGAHRLRDIVALTSLPQETVCRLLRQGETKYGLFTRPQYGYYAIAEGFGPANAEPLLGAPGLREPLRRLAVRTGAAVLAYGATTDGRARVRKLLAHDFGRLNLPLMNAQRRDQEAVVSAPLTVDAAGIAILGPLASTFHIQAAAARWSADGTTVWSPAPVAGLDMVAAPLWRGREVAGSLALMVAHETPYERAAAARALASAAADLSRLAVRHAPHAGQLAS